MPSDIPHDFCYWVFDLAKSEHAVKMYEINYWEFYGPGGGPHNLNEAYFINAHQCIKKHFYTMHVHSRNFSATLLDFDDSPPPSTPCLMTNDSSMVYVGRRSVRAHHIDRVTLNDWKWDPPDGSITIQSADERRWFGSLFINGVVEDVAAGEVELYAPKDAMPLKPPLKTRFFYEDEDNVFEIVNDKQTR